MHPYRIPIDSVRRNVQNKAELIFILMLFVAIFFRLFRYNIGTLSFTAYLTYPIAFVFIMFQILNYIELNYHRTLFIVYFLFLSWLMYGVITLFYTVSYELSIATLELRFASFLNFYVVTQFLTTRRRFLAFETTLFICLLWNIGVAAWEIMTLNHLRISRFYEIPYFIPTGAFLSENTFASKLLVSSTFLFFIKGKYLKYVAITMLFLLFIIFCTQGVRLALIVFTPILLYVFFKRTNYIYKICVLFTLIFVLHYLFSTNPIMKIIVKNHIETQILSLGNELQSVSVGSTRARIAVIKEGLQGLASSGGFGIGVGSFAMLVQQPHCKADIMNSINAHLMLLEVLATEGFIGFFLLIFILFSCLKPILFKDNKFSFFSLFRLRSLTQDEKHVLLILLFIIVGTTLIASYRTKFLYWIILGYGYSMMYNKSFPEESSLLGEKT